MKADDLQNLAKQNVDQYKNLYKTYTFYEFLELVKKNPKIVQNAFQRTYDMILSRGKEEIKEYKDKIVKYNFFTDPITNGKDAVYGLDKPLMYFVDLLKAAAAGLGPERRIVLLHGPVGSAKSTVARLLKKGLEGYSKTEEGALYSFKWQDPEDENIWHKCPMHEDPLHLIPLEVRNEKFYEDLGVTFKIEPQELCPHCQWYYNVYLEKYGGDWTKVLNHAKIIRVILSEAQRVGIGTFQPKDEKNQDSTELTGDINYRKIAIYGSDSDPRAFDFTGEFNIANRGIIEFVEVLKLDVAFLYDLLGATQEHKIKPKKFPQCDIDEIIISHSNNPEFQKLQENEFMEALRDRTIRVDIPYNVKLDDEIKIYKKDFTSSKIKEKHIAPHTIEMAAMWAVLSRLEDPRKADITAIQKMKLYNGKSVTGYTDEHVKELKDAAPNEGMKGISPRYIQDKISQALSTAEGGCINPFMVMNALKTGLSKSTLITSEDEKKKYEDLLADVRVEYEDIVKKEVQRAIAADKKALETLCSNYIENVRAYCSKEKVKNEFTGEDEAPNEELMRSIEKKLDINDGAKDAFRHEIMQYIGTLAVKNKQFTYQTDDRLREALEKKLFEDSKDSIKLTAVISEVTSDEEQKKIEVVEKRLIDNYGYCAECARNILKFVASIFARGDAKEEE